MAEILKRLTAALVLTTTVSVGALATAARADDGTVTASGAALAGADGAGREFVGVRPSRAFDSRTGIGALTASAPIEVQLAGIGAVPGGADSVAVNVTVTGATGSGYLVVYPAGTTAPVASSVNFKAGEHRSNLVVAKLGSAGRVAVAANVTTDVVIDVVGYFVNPVLSGTGSRLHPVTPARLVDSRTALGVAAALNEGTDVRVVATGRAGVAAGADAVLVNVTATGATAGTYITAYPGGGGRPETSSLNIAAGEIRSNLAIVPLGPDGSIGLFNYAGRVDVVVDVLAYFSRSGAGVEGQVVISSPSRLFDSRLAHVVLGSAAPGTMTFDLGVSGTDTVITAAILNVTQVSPSRHSYLTVWPYGVDQPLASNVNTAAGDIVANLVVVPLGPDGMVNFANYDGNTGLVIDLVGVVIA